MLRFSAVITTVAALSLLSVNLAIAQLCYTEPDGTKHFVGSKNDVPADLRGRIGCVPVAPSPAATPTQQMQPGHMTSDPVPPETISPACLDGINRLVTKSSGSVSRDDVGRELGGECEQQFVMMFQRAADLATICADFMRGALGEDPNRLVTRAEVLRTARPECRDFAERAWNNLDREGKLIRRW